MKILVAMAKNSVAKTLSIVISAPEMTPASSWAFDDIKPIDMPIPLPAPQEKPTIAKASAMSHKGVWVVKTANKIKPRMLAKKLYG